MAPTGQACKAECEPDGIDWGAEGDEKSETDVAKDPTPELSPTPVADDEQGGPLKLFPETPVRPDAWSPCDNVVVRNALRIIQGAEDSPRRAVSA
eukprot:6478658-Pyramimonas_sp.AAC.1